MSRGCALVKITAQELEDFAVKIANPGFNIDVDDGIRELIGHLDFDDYDAVLRRAAEIVRKQIGVAEEYERLAERVERWRHADPSEDFSQR